MRGGRRARDLAVRLRPGAIVVLVAALASLLVLFRPTLSPPGIHSRDLFTHGVAKRMIMVDTPTSNLVDRDQDALGPPSVALTYALYLQTDLARAQLAARLGVPSSLVAASGPYTLLLPRPNLVIARANPVPPPSPRPADSPYRLLLDVTDGQPALSIFAQAPTVEQARIMVATAAGIVQRYVADQQRRVHVPEESRSVLRTLGGIDSAQVDRGAGRELAIGVFMLVCLGGALVVYRRARRRTAVTGAVPREGPVEPAHPALDDWPHTHRLLPWMLAGFLVMIFIVPFGAIEVPLPLPGDGVLDRPYILALTFVWLAGLVGLRGAGRPRVRITRIHLAVLVFFGICLLSAAINVGALSQIGLLGTGIKKLVVLVNYLLLFIVAASSIRPREVPRFAALLAGLAAITAVGTVVESRFDYNVFYELWSHVFVGMVSIPTDLHGLDEIGRPTIYGPTSQPLELATMLALAVPFAVLGLLDSAEKRIRVRYGLLLALLLAAGFSTGRKTSVVVPVVALVVVFAYRPGSLRRLAPTALVLGVLVKVLAPGTLGSMFFQLTHVGAVKSTQARSADYDAVWSDVTGHLLLGRGFKTFDPHVFRILDNEYLGLLIGVGLIGVVAFLSIFAAMVSSAHSTIRGADSARARYALACTACAISTAVASFLFDMLSFPHVPYLLLFLAGMVVALREPSPPADGEPLAVHAPVPVPDFPPAPEPARDAVAVG